MSETPVTANQTEGVAAQPEPDVKDAGALVTAFLKALKAYRMYLPNNRTLLAFVEAFYRLLESFVSEHGHLCLRVSQFHIGYRGIAVYENQVKEESLAFRMFIHGVREFTFHPGVPVQEVTDFLQVIHRSFDSQTTVDDLLTLLWEKDLKYITFIILDDFFDEGEQAAFDEFVEEGRRADHTASQPRMNARPLLDRLLPDSGEISAEPLPEIFHLTDEDHARIAEWIEAEQDRDPILDLCGLILELFDSSFSAEDSKDLLLALDRVLEALLDEGKITQAANVLAELRRFSGVAGSGHLQRVVDEALERIGGERVVQAVRPHLSAALEEDHGVLVEFLASLDQTAVVPLIDLLEFSDVRGIVLEVLERMAVNHLGVILLKLEDGRPSVVGTLVRLLGSVGDGRALPALESALSHQVSAVRTEAVRAIERIGTEPAMQLLARILMDSDQDIRVLAVRAIASMPAEFSRDALLNVVKGRDFAKRSYFEKKEILLALGRVPDAEVEDHLIGILKKRRWFRRDEGDDLRACAVNALSARRTPGAIAALHSHANDRSPQVKRAVALALRTLELAP